MNRTVQAQTRQDLVVGRLGGTWQSANFRVSDTLGVLVGILNALIGLGAYDRNLSSSAVDALEELAEDFPLAVDANGVTVAVAAQMAALVEDPSVLAELRADDARDAAWDVVENLLAEASCTLDGSNGVAVYPEEVEVEV